MPQRKQLTWGELRVGIFVLVGILVIGLGVFYVTGTGAWGAKYRLVTYLPEVDGLTLGAQVTLDGVEIGNVDNIRIAQRKPGEKPDANRSVQVVVRVNRSFQDYIRADSTATLLTQGFLGDRVLSVERGYTGRVLQDGEEIPGVEEKAIKQVLDRGADLMQNLNNLSTQISSVVGGIQRGQGTLGKIVADPTLYNHLNATLERADQLSTSIQQGQGTLGKLVASDELYGKLNSAAGHIDNALEAIDQQKGTIGKLIYDPSIHDSAKAFLNNGNGVLGDMRAGRGTLGKLATDDSLFASWKQIGDNLKEATGKLNSNQNTAGKFFSDPQLYDNLTGLSGDLRLLAGEFRSDPKKFLHVRFSLF